MAPGSEATEAVYRLGRRSFFDYGILIGFACEKLGASPMQRQFTNTK